MLGSRDIRPSARSGHTEDVVGTPRDVVAPLQRSGSEGIGAVEGFRVDGPDGRIGVVTRVFPSTGGGAPDTIDVVTGLFIVRVVPVAGSEIVQIDAEHRRLVIRSMVRLSRTPNVARMLRRFLASVR
ncbi:MAG: hypothetical protein ACRDQE_17005 [Gaiellales bacterium]